MTLAQSIAHQLILHRFLLRRAAVRTLSQQSQSIARTFQPLSTRVTSFTQSSSKPIAWRAFHQARIWRAEEEQKGDIAKEGGESPAERADAAETVTAEPSAEEQQAEIKEESVATPEVADAAHQETTPETVAEKAEEVAVKTAQDFAQSARSGAAAVSSAADSLGSSRDARRPSRLQRDTQSTHRNPRPSRIIYVGNLFFEVTAEQLEAEFARFGTITNSRIVTDARGLSKGFGYIEMAEQESADAAVRELDQKVFQGRRMAVQYHVARDRNRGNDMGARSDRSTPREPKEPSKTLFIGNMSYQMSDRDLNDLFREIRDVLDVRVAIDRRSGQPRGFAHADFIDVQSAQRAKELLERKVVYGRQLRVDFSGSSTNASRE